MNAVTQKVMGGGVAARMGGRSLVSLAWSGKLSKTAFQPLHKRSITTVHSGSTSTRDVPPSASLLSDMNPKCLDPVWSVNPRLSPLMETASYYAGKSRLTQAHTSSAVAAVVPQVIELPSLDGERTKPAVESPPPPNVVTWITTPLQRQAEISDPVERSPIQAPTPVGPTKYAHRLLRLKKKKMKTHRRKKLWKRMWTVWKKKFYGRERKREIEFRTRLIEAVREAEKFNAEQYVSTYLKDFKYEFIPKTYKGMKKHPDTIAELFEKDKQYAIRYKLNRTNLKTGESLIKPGETVEDFVKRNA